MSGITGIGRAGPAGPGQLRGAASGSGFSVSTPERAGQSAATAPPAEISLSALLALQAEDSSDIRDRQARRRGQDLLAELAALQRSLLRGDCSGSDLAPLASLVAGVPEAADPGLRRLLNDITLRARVELARFGLVDD